MQLTTGFNSLNFGSLNHPGIDSGRLVGRALNSKSLATLSKEEDRYQQMNKPEDTASHYRPPLKTFREKVIIAAKCIKTGDYDPLLKASQFEVKDSPLGREIYGTYISSEFAKLGVNEAEMLKDIKVLHGDLILDENSAMVDTCDLDYVDGSVFIYKGSAIKDLSKLKKVFGSIYLYDETRTFAQLGVQKGLATMGVSRSF